MTYTLLAYRVRKSASSTAASPPPTTAITCSRKKAPSQMAQYETPRPAKASSPGMPSLTGVPPAVRMTAGAEYTSPVSVTASNVPASGPGAPLTLAVTNSAPDSPAGPSHFRASSQPGNDFSP